MKKQIEALFQPVIGQKAWGPSIGLGSFVTIEFGPKRLYHRHYHGDWHLWLYLCDWELTSNGRLLADSEGKKKVMQLAIDNLDGVVLTGLSFDSQRMITVFMFDENLRLRCKPYSDATPDEEYWIFYTPNGKGASLRKSGLSYESVERTESVSLARR